MSYFITFLQLNELCQAKKSQSALHVRDTLVKRYNCIQIIHSRLVLHDLRSNDIRLFIGPYQVLSTNTYRILMYAITITFNFAFLTSVFSVLCTEPSPLHSPAPPSSTFLSRLFHCSLSDSHDTSLSSSLDPARNLLKPRGQSGEGTELQGRSPAVVEVPYAKGKHVCSYSLSDIQLHLISRRETLARGRNRKDFSPRRTLLLEAHGLPSPMPCSSTVQKLRLIHPYNHS